MNLSFFTREHIPSQLSSSRSLFISTDSHATRNTKVVHLAALLYRPISVVAGTASLAVSRYKSPGFRKEKREGHIIQNTFRRLYTCVTWHTWPPNHSDTHLSGTTAPTCWILLLSSSHFQHATPGAHRQCGRHTSFTHLQPRRSFFLPSFLLSSNDRTQSRTTFSACWIGTCRHSQTLSRLLHHRTVSSNEEVRLVLFI